MNKVLSIIIPTYNMEDYLRQCLDSLIIADDLMQQLEVLVINDGSKDQSSAIAHEYSRKHPSTIFVIDKENGNYGSCINRGLKEATGKFIKILDADDSFDSAALAEFINQLRNTNADLVITNFSVVDSEGRTQQEVKYLLGESIFDISAYKEKALEMHAITYRKNILDSMEYRQSEGISYTDTEWAILPMTVVNDVKFFNLRLYKYLCGRSGQTVEKDTLAKRSHQLIHIMNGILTKLSSQDIKPNSQTYFDIVIPQKLNYVYSIVLLKGNEWQRRELKKTDLFLKANFSEYYNFLDAVKYSFIPVRFIHLWRNNRLIYGLFIRIVLILRKGLLPKEV